ncbi:unnamed protein product [Albugo candida]|uniref:Uncharacterized protein n=1 Tax=Albugo candida TaxID=65357 RepID=A0A024FTM5_9STRA|nr:unnamed protein product [Albugo candida]|eukprot:CCI10391.1 unnamed protein product [Albugo candida]
MEVEPIGRFHQSGSTHQRLQQRLRLRWTSGPGLKVQRFVSADHAGASWCNDLIRIQRASLELLERRNCGCDYCVRCALLLEINSSASTHCIKLYRSIDRIQRELSSQ